MALSSAHSPLDAKTAPAAADAVLGVIGGMGPAATVDFLAKLVAVTPVQTEQDHLRVLVDSNPRVPDRNRAIAAGLAAPATAPHPRPAAQDPGPVLASVAAGLERAGASFIVMACNTAHAFEPAIRAAVRVPFVSMVEEAGDECLRRHPGARRAGLLAAPGCVQAGLYQAALGHRGLDVLLLDDAAQARFTELLYRIKLGDTGPAVRDVMQQLARGLAQAGAELIVAGCTEVPLVLDAAAAPVPLVDATLNLAQRCVLYARGIEPFPRHAVPEFLQHALPAAARLVAAGVAQHAASESSPVSPTSFSVPKV
jgi:aspartate racemase